MRGVKLLISLVVGGGVTFLQLLAVGGLNDSSIIAAEAARPPKPPLMVPVAQLPAQRKVPPRPQKAQRTSASQPLAAAAVARGTALPGFKGTPAKLGLLNVLPGLGNVGLGTVDLPDAPTEPDRPARARRTAQPMYPINAQRDGIEGYVILRLNIDANGRVTSVLVVDSEPIGVFERSAREAARRFEFVPARVNGSAASATIEKKIVFNLQ